jgi:hypothetical protein
MYLNTSRKLAGEVTLGDFTGDGRCDVRAKDTGEVFASGRTTAPRADVLWCNPATGGTRLWQVKNGVAAANIMPPAFAPGCTVLGGGDFNADGIADLVYRNASNEVFVTLLTAAGGREVPAGNRTERQGVMPATSALAGVGDFNADKRSDLLWRHANGDLEMWLGGESGNRSYPRWLNDPAQKTGNEWQIKGLGDFDGDGRSDILWRHDNGTPAIWFMNGEYYASEVHTPFNDPTAIWKIQTTGDFDGDGRSDILWRHNDGGLAIWFRGQSNLAAYPSWLNQGGRTGLDWQIKAVADINADRRDDIIWQNNNGNVVSWVMDGGRFVTEFLTGVGPAGYNLLRAVPSTPR